MSCKSCGLLGTWFLLVPEAQGFMVLSFSVKLVKATLFQKHDQTLVPTELATCCSKPFDEPSYTH